MDDPTLTATICGLLGAVPGWEWRPDGPAYQSTELGISYGSIPPNPDRGIGVRIYSADDARDLLTRRVQLRFRGTPGRPDGADNLASVAFAALNGLSRVGGISGISRISMAPLGADANGREERTDNYEVTLDNTGAQS